MRTRSLVLLGSGALLLGLVAQAPAASLYAWLTPKDKPAIFQLSGVQGTLIKGRAAGATLQGQPALTSLNWTLQPLQLLLARIGFHLDAEAPQTVISADVALLPTGAVHLKPLRSSGALKPLLGMVGLTYLPAEGQARLDAKKLVLKKQWPTAAEGVLEIQNLAWTLAREPVLLGDFQAELKTTPEGISADIKSIAGPLDVSGTMLARGDRSYRLQAKFRAKPEASPDLRNLLAAAGSPDAQGYYQIKQEGTAP